MKNKKLVATVASLCLVVVAVVAAVVGVFAAVTQYSQGKFTVNYTAQDVYATVGFRSKGPVLTVQSSTRSMSAWSTLSSYSFAPTNTTIDNGQQTFASQFVADEYNFGWDDNAGKTNGVDSATADGEFLGYSLYEFSFTNNNAERAMRVTPSVSLDTTNLSVFYFTGTLAAGENSIAYIRTEASTNVELTNADWGSTGAFNGNWTGTETPTSTVRLSTNATDTALQPRQAILEGAAQNFTVAASGSLYLYVLVVVKNAAVTASTVTGTINFTLANVAA